jgi:hypothetical protein
MLCLLSAGWHESSMILQYYALLGLLSAGWLELSLLSWITYTYVLLCLGLVRLAISLNNSKI